MAHGKCTGSLCICPLAQVALAAGANGLSVSVIHASGVPFLKNCNAHS